MSRGVAIAAVLCGLVTLKTSMSFLTGVPTHLPDHRQGLRGSQSSAPNSASHGAEVLPGSLLAMGTLAAVVAARRRDASSVTMRLTRSQWYREVKRISGDRAIFDVTVKKPLGIKLEPIPKRKGDTYYRGVGVSEVVPGGNTDVLNEKVCTTEEDPGMWILEGDRVIAIDGQECVEASFDEIVKLIQANQDDEITMTLVRNTRSGPIRVVLLPGGETVTVRRNAKLAQAAEVAFGKELKYGCVDGWCGTCWHRERSTNGVFKPCCDLLTGDWDNVMPLVLTPKPERAGDAKMGEERGA